MDRPQFILGLITVIFGALMLFIVIPAQHIPPLMSSVSPDFYPNIGTVFLLVGGIGMTLSGLRGKRTPIPTDAIKQALKYNGIMILIFGITLSGFYFFGFLAGGMFLIPVTMLLLKEHRPLRFIFVTLLSPLCIWLFIEVFLGRALP